MDRKQIAATIAGTGLVAASLFGAVAVASGSGGVQVVEPVSSVVATDGATDTPLEVVALAPAEASAPPADEYEEDDYEDHDEYEEDEDHHEYEEDEDHHEYDEDEDHDEYEDHDDEEDEYEDHDEYEEDEDHDEYEYEDHDEYEEEDDDDD